jgi:hypothetical protein
MAMIVLGVGIFIWIRGRQTHHWRLNIFKTMFTIWLADDRG